MTRPQTANPTQRDESTSRAWVRIAVFALLLCALAVRPLIPETFELAQLSFLSNVIDSGGPTPATTAALDTLLIAVAALAWFVSSPTRGSRVLLVATAALLVAAGASCVFAGDKRVALNAAGNIVACVVAGAAMVRLIGARWMLRLVLAAIIAGGAVNALKCITQASSEFKLVAEQWEHQKELLRKRGADLDDPLIVNYERRLHSAEAFGYLFHPNVTAACMSISLLLALAVAVAALKRPQTRTTLLWAAIAAALVVALSIGVWLTGSAGAAVAIASGLLVLAVFVLFPGPASRHPRAIVSLICAAYLLVIAGGAGYGVLRGTLPHPSLAFRWDYWTAATTALVDESPPQALVGLGRENFLPAYLRYKSAAATEEVRNAHNVWLTLLVEMGPPALLAGLLLSVCVLARAVPRPTPPPKDCVTPRSVVVIVVLLFLVLHAAFSGTQFSQPGVGIVWGIEFAAAWTLAFLLALRSMELLTDSAAAALLIRGGMAAAIVAALVHNLVGFSLFTPAGLSVFVLLCVCAVASAPDRRGASMAAQRVVGVALAVIALTQAALCTTPTWRSERALLQMRRGLASARSFDQAAAAIPLGREAVALDRWSVTAKRALVRALEQLAATPSLPSDAEREWTDRALDAARAAVRSHPRDTGLLRALAGTLEQRARLHDRSGQHNDAVTLRRRAADALERVVGLYPTNPRDLISAARAHVAVWRETADEADVRTAREEFARALEIDALRAKGNTARLRRDELAAIHDALRELELHESDTGADPIP